MDVSLPTIFMIAVIALLAPGPAVLVIIGTALSQGTRRAMGVAAGIVTVSLMWSALAAFGMAAMIFANAWILEAVRIAGGLYLLFLAGRSALSALRPGLPQPSVAALSSLRAAYGRGLAVHLTNPKPVLFFGSLFALAVPPGASVETLLAVIATVAVPTVLVFFGLAIAFSRPGMVRLYAGARRWIEAAFAIAFGVIGVRMLASRVPS